ncbi:hypothetical protein BH11BAC3_BH11BAC3_02170 [soil metagenome]
MKHVIIITAILLFSFKALPQTFAYELLDAQKVEGTEQLISIKDGFLHFETGLNRRPLATPDATVNKFPDFHKITVNKLDNQLKQIASKPLFGGKKIVRWLYNPIKLNDKVYVIYHDLDRENEGAVKLARIDEQTLEAVDEMTLFDFSKNKVSIDYKKIIKKEYATFSFRLSENEKNLMITIDPQVEYDDPKIVFVSIFDENLKPVLEKRVDFKAAQNKVSVQSIICDNSGNAYIAYGDYTNKKVVTGLLDNDKTLLILQPGNKPNIKLNLDIKDYSMTDVNLVYTPQQNKVYAMGPFNIGWGENLVGVYQAYIDLKTMQLSNPVNTKFPEELVSKVAEDGYAKTKDKNYGLLRNFFNYCVVRGDGSVDMIMRYTEAVPIQGKGLLYAADFYGGDFIDVHLLNGKTQFTRIGRNMKIGQDLRNYLWSATFVKDDKLILIYNDNEKNINRPIDETAKAGAIASSELCASIIDSKGNVTRQRMMEGNSDNTVAYLDHLYSIDKNTFLVMIDRFTILKIKNKYAKFSVK